MQSSCGQYSSRVLAATHMSDISDIQGSTRRTDGYLLRDFVRAGTKALETNRDTINALNVFPVPDGDTGTNMVLTMRSIRDELDREIDANPSITSARMARAALLGARGNSGLILAQYFKGLAESLADGYEVSGEGFARGLRIAADIAYRAVPEPKEGTMLTVFRECADASEAAVKEREGLPHVLEVAAAQAMDTVSRTPEMLDVLRDAGVVDSGGFGFAIMLKAGVDLLAGRDPGADHVTPPNGNTAASDVGLSTGIRAEFLEDIEEEAWGYCTVFAIEGTDLDPESVRKQMAELGRSPVVAGTDTVIKVHVHMEDPGTALSAGLKLGSLSNIDIHNMDEQAREWANNRASEAGGTATTDTTFTTGIVAVAVGDGFKQLFESAGLGAVELVIGGDSMNPSTAEIVDAISNAPSDSVVVLPNNKNVIGTAQQAAQLVEKTTKVLESRSMQSGLAALLEFSPDREIGENFEQMQEPLSIVRSGSVSIAQRDALLDGVPVKKGQHMGILDEKLVAAGESAMDVLVQMLKSQVDEESLLTLYSGQDIYEDDVEEVITQLERSLPGIEIESLSGGQPGYDFLLSIE